MKLKFEITLKPVPSEDNETVRIYNLTKEFIENLHNYGMDFLTTIQILLEDKEKLSKSKDVKNREKLKDIEEKIKYMEGKMEDLYSRMKEMAGGWASLVELKEEENS